MLAFHTRDMQAWRQAEGADELYGKDPNGEAFPEMKQLLKVGPKSCNHAGRPATIAGMFATVGQGRMYQVHTLGSLVDATGHLRRARRQTGLVSGFRCTLWHVRSVT